MVILNFIFRWAIVGVGFLFPKLCFSQLNIMTFEQVEERQINKPRNKIVFIHTDWCKYCQLMENTTFKNKEVIEKLNKYFYFIKFNAEEKNHIEFVGKNFRYKPNGTNTGIHELVEELGKINGKVSYPTIVVLNNEDEIIFQYNGFMKAPELLKVLNQM